MVRLVVFLKDMLLGILIKVFVGEVIFDVKVLVSLLK